MVDGGRGEADGRWWRRQAGGEVRRAVDGGW